MQAPSVQPVIPAELSVQLATLLYAEQRRVRRLDRIAGEVADPEVGRLLMCHRKEAERHVERLQRAFLFLGQSSYEQPCADLDEIFAHAEVAGTILSGVAWDELQLNVTQRLQQYRSEAYRRVLAMAGEAGLDKVATMLRANFQEETAAGIELERYSTVLTS